MDAVKWLGFFAGLAVVVGTAGSIVRTLVVPRGLTSRLTVFVGRRLTRRAFCLSPTASRAMR